MIGDGTDTAPNEVERAWHIYLAGLDSGFNYYGGMGNDDEVKQSLANRRALEILQPWMTTERLALDQTPPTVFRPQRFPWNPGGYTFGWFNTTPSDGNYRKKMGSDFYVWTHAYDVSGIPADGVVLKVRKDKDGINSLATTHNETYAGGDDVEDWIDIPMIKRTLPKTRSALNAAADNGEIDYFIEAVEIADYYFAKVEGYRDVLLDYYIEARDTKGNVYKSDIQHVYVEDDGTPSGSNPSASFSPSKPSDCAPLTVTFNAAESALASAATVYAFYHFSTNETDWASAAMTRTSSNTFTITFNEIPDNAPQLEICFYDGADNWESNGGKNWKINIIDCDAPIWENGVNLSAVVPDAGEPITISYDTAGRALASAAAINIHYGYNGGNWTTAPGVAMTKIGNLWTFQYVIPEAATNIVMCFNDGNNNWDNNGGNNWTFEVAAAPPVPDGLVITNPPGSTLTVPASPYNIQGTAGNNLTGAILWTNSGTGATGALVRSSSWSLPMTLTGGANAIILSAAIAGTGNSGGITVESDSGANGFDAWTINAEEPNSGSFLNTTNANCSVGTPAWSLWANSSNTVEAIRPFAEPLAVGDTFSIDMDNNHVDTGFGIGIALQNVDGDTLWQFFFNGGDTNYSRSGGTTDITWTDSGIAVEFTLLTANTYEVVINPAGRDTRTYTGMLEADEDQQIARFRAWNHSAGPGSAANFYFNNLRITRPGEPTEPDYATASVTLILNGGGGGDFLVPSAPQFSSGKISLSLPATIPGAIYNLLESTNLTAEDGGWTTTLVINATGGAIEFIPTNLYPYGFYRLYYTTP